MQLPTIWMKFQILFSGENKKNIINLSSVETAQMVVSSVEIVQRVVTIIGKALW